MGCTSENKIIMDNDSMARIVKRISYEIIERNKGADNLCIIGIKRRGVVIGEKIRRQIEQIENVRVPFGELDTTLYRDDLERGNCADLVDSVAFGFDISGMKVILVDDVLYTGRTARAALDALSHMGRAAMIQLAVMVDRGHRELPVRADYVGKNVPTSQNEIIRVKVSEIDGCNCVLIEENIK